MPTDAGSFAEYAGRTELREDRVDPRLIEGLAATLGRERPKAELPPLWHWMLFQDWRQPDAVGPDGHPRRGGFLPPVHDLPRRMWAGGRLSFTGAGLAADETVRRTSTIRRVDEKTGSTGRLVFVTVHHLIEGPRGVVLEEEQDIVYRGTEGAAVKPAEPAPAIPQAKAATVLPDSVMLFRYSALTGNGHRIHYDFPYVTQTEGYPGLIVHGPLQATLLAQHILDHAGGQARLSRFSFRGRRPAFADRPLTLLAALDTPQARAESRDPDGAICMQADATLA